MIEYVQAHPCPFSPSQGEKVADRPDEGVRRDSKHPKFSLWMTCSIAETAPRTIGTIVLHWIGLLIACITSTNACAAHPVSVTRTLVYVTRARVNVTVEVFLEDLVLFHNLKPDATDSLDAPTIRSGIKLHRDFVATRFVIQDAEGAIHEPDQLSKVTAEIPEAGVPMAQLMAHKLTFDMQYTFTRPPEFLTFQQRFTDPDGVLLSEMQLQVKQENAAETFSKALVANTPETIRFDWTNPPLSAEASQQERERWAQQQQEEALGITSYSSVYSFLYIEPQEIRHEILIPLMTLEQSIPLKREHENFLSIVEQDAARQLIEDFFLTGNPIAVNGKTVKPIVERCDFYGVDFRDFAQLSQRKQVAMSNARVGIILVYPLSSAPKHVQLTWDRFHKSLWAVTTVVFAEDQSFRKTLSRVGANNVLEWTAPDDSSMNRLKPLTPIPAILPPQPMIDVPVLSLIVLAIAMVAVTLWISSRNGWPGVESDSSKPRGFLRFAQSSPGHPVKTQRHVRWIKLSAAILAATMITTASAWSGAGRWQIPWGTAPPISSGEASIVAGQVLSNIYQSFRGRGEDEVYDALAVSTSGDVLQDLYLQIQESLRMAEQGGAVARVRHVELLESKLQPRTSDDQSRSHAQSFSCLCRWNVSGTVEHWGHIHERTNQFEAIFLIEPIAESLTGGMPTILHWKLTRLDITNSQRLHSQTRLRTL